MDNYYLLAFEEANAQGLNWSEKIWCYNLDKSFIHNKERYKHHNHITSKIKNILYRDV